MPLPGFDRFFDEPAVRVSSAKLEMVFGPDSIYAGAAVGIGSDPTAIRSRAVALALRVLPPDWHDPANGGPDVVMTQFSSADEYTFYQANRFYRREPPSDAEREMRRRT